MHGIKIRKCAIAFLFPFSLYGILIFSNTFKLDLFYLNHLFSITFKSRQIVSKQIVFTILKFIPSRLKNKISEEFKFCFNNKEVFFAVNLVWRNDIGKTIKNSRYFYGPFLWTKSVFKCLRIYSSKKLALPKELFFWGKPINQNEHWHPCTHSLALNKNDKTIFVNKQNSRIYILSKWAVWIISLQKKLSRFEFLKNFPLNNEGRLLNFTYQQAIWLSDLKL